MNFRLLSTLLLLVPLNLIAQTVIVDNGGVGYSVRKGSWSPSATTGYHGTNSLINFVDGLNDRVRWTPNLPRESRYAVAAWWVSSSNRASDAPYDVTHGGGTTRVVVD